MSEVAHRQVDNSSYKTTIDIGASTWKQVSWYFVNILFFKNPFNMFSGLKVQLLKLFGAELGSGVVIKPSVNIKFPWKLKIASAVRAGMAFGRMICANIR